MLRISLVGITARRFPAPRFPRREFNVSTKPLSKADWVSSPLFGEERTPSRIREGTEGSRFPKYPARNAKKPTIASRMTTAAAIGERSEREDFGWIVVTRDWLDETSVSSAARTAPAL